MKTNVNLYILVKYGQKLSISFGVFDYQNKKINNFKMAEVRTLILARYNALEQEYLHIKFGYNWVKGYRDIVF